MGGALAITLREPDGTEHRMIRWTNSLPWFVKNMRFVNKEQAHINNYMKQYNDMQNDWEKHKDDKKFKFPMTEVYTPYPGGLAPAGYGLVVIDMANNVILTMQNYCQFYELHGAEINLDLYNREDGLGNSEEDAYQRAKEFMEAGKGIPVYIGQKKKRGQKKPEYTQIECPDISFDDFIKDIRDERKIAPWKNKRRAWAIKLDLSPFEIKEFNGEDVIQEIKRLKQEIVKLGFKLSKDEEKDWDEYIAEIDEYE